MGFDNECIVNIQSLAGEYFCPVCRTLVYPNEALQSQCTHLYCKLCLTYVVGTTKACPYDGYLVTEKDSKPLVESDKALADRIGKTLVHCLFHMSGCSWQGPLSECTSHCSGCSFGNSHVVCNRCGVQIIHRQVQEHAQSCAGANPHAQQTAENSKDGAIAVAVTTANSSQTSFQRYAGYNAYQQYYPYQQPHAQQVQQHAAYVGQPQVNALNQTEMQGLYQPLPQVQGQGQAQAQPQPQGQGQPQAQSFVQNQVNPQQQSHLVTQPHPHIQVNIQTAAQGQIPQQQPYPQAQPPPLPYSMQPPAQQNLQETLYQQAPSQGHQAQIQTQPQPQSNPQPVLQFQPQSHPFPHPLLPNHPQSQKPAPSVVPGYQSHPPVQSHQQILQAPQQNYSMPMHPSSGSFLPAAQFPQQSPQSNALLPNQQQPNQMPSQSQIQGVPTAQHPQIYLQAPQQGYVAHQRPAVQPMHQPFQQSGKQPFPSQPSSSVQGPLHQIPLSQQPMQTQSQPQGPTQSQQSVVACPPPPPQCSVQAHGMPPQHHQAYGGRPVAPNQMAASHPFPHSGGVFGSAAHSRPLPSSSVQPSGHQIFEGGNQQVPYGQQFSQSTLKKTAGNDVSGPGEDSVRVKTLESEIRGTSGNEKHKITSEGKNNATHNETRSKVAKAEVDALKTGSSEPLLKKIVKEEVANCNLDSLSGGNKLVTATLHEKDDSVFAAKQTKNSSVKFSTYRQTEAYFGHKKDDTNVLAQENKLSLEQATPQGPAVNEYAGSHDKGLMSSSNPAPLTDQGRYQMPLGTFGPSSQQQRTAVPSNSPSGSYLGAPPNALSGEGPAHLKPQGPGLSGPLHQSRFPSEHYQGVQRGQIYLNNPRSQPPFSKTIKVEPSGPLHGSDGAALLQDQRLHHLEGRYPDSHVLGSFDRGLYEQPLANENRGPAFEAAAGVGLNVKNVDDHRNQFMTGPARPIGQGNYEQALKQFPKPPPTNFGNGSLRKGHYPLECNSEIPSNFFPPNHPSGTSHANNVGKRLTGTQPDFHGSGPGFGVDRLPPRSPGREYYGMPFRGFAGQLGGPHNQPGLYNVHGWGTHAVHEGPRSFDMSSDPAGKPLRDHFRSGDMAGQDFIPNHLRRGELFGPRNVPSHSHAVDSFGTFPDPRMGELTGHGGFPNTESFVGNKSHHPRLGEPGFRSSFSLHGFPSSGGFYAGNLDSFDRFRKRIPTSMGWCRICKVDCDSVDGLDLHSQTTEHQLRTMDMVISIKQQNAKRQKTSKDHSSLEEGIRSRNTGNRGQGNKA